MNTDLIEISENSITIIDNIPFKKSGYKDWQSLSKNNLIILKNEIGEAYNNGYGFKLIAKKIKLSYTQCRRLLINILNIKTRIGTSVVTDKLREIRVENAIKIGRFNNWPKKYPQIQKLNNRGIQGYYWNKSFNKWVWLRSSYEFIYAKWLDSKNIIWDSEVKYFILPNGEKYLPDFFIFKNDKITIESLVEIKGEYKIYDRGKQDILISNYPIITVKNIKLFLLNGSSKMKELRLWKKLRKLSLE